LSELVVAREPLANILESGLADLLVAHWGEVAHDRDQISLDPDWDGYLQDEREHRFIAWSARRDGVLVGYSAFFTVRPRHYRANIFAINDVIYLKPGERGADGVQMILLVERELKALGATKVFYHVKTDAVLGQVGDSLEAVEQMQEVEANIGVDLPDALFANDRTLGGVLAALGYNHIENHFGKLLLEKS
jgi:hypothetical protein